MRWLGLFILRPVTTTLLALAMVGAGLIAYLFLAVAPLPQVDFPMISVTARLSGASPRTMASSVATPLEQSLGSIDGISEMRSRSSEGSTRITLMFDMDRDINAAARDVQAAINAAHGLLPSALRDPPSYNKVNPASSPVMVLALTSPTATQGELYDLAATVIAQKLAQVSGVGEVSIGGSSLPAVRVSLDPVALNAAGIALDDVRAALADANSMRPNGLVENESHYWQILSNDALRRADEYRPLIIAWRDGAPVRLRDVARVTDSVEDRNNMGFLGDSQAVLLTVRRQADANIIATVDGIRDQLPALQSLLPAQVSLTVAQDRTPSIRASLAEAEFTLIVAVALVFMVVLVFLGNLRAALIPAIAVPASLISTFSLMLWFGYTLNTISLMALIVATGFVVDDAIVVLENVMRYLEKGVSARRAALRGAREVGFTVLAMSLSLIAVFLPMLLMRGLVGNFFREFAVTLSVAVMLSLLLSLTLTPMMCARGLRAPDGRRAGRLRRALLATGTVFARAYARSLDWALVHSRLVLVILLATIGLNISLYTMIPKGFFPQQDTGQLMGFFRVDQGTSFEAMWPRFERFRHVLLQDPAIDSVAGFIGGRGGSTSSFLMIQLKPVSERDVSANQVVNRLRPHFAREPGARLTLVPQQDIFVGGRTGSAGSYEYGLLAGDLDDLNEWLPQVRHAMAALPELADVDTDVEDRGRRVQLTVDRDTASRLGISMSLITATLNNAFSERQVSVIFDALNQYHVVMALDDEYARDLSSLEQLQVITGDGRRVPLSAFTRLEMGNAPLSVSHSGLFASESVSFNLAEGVALQEATRAIDAAVARIGLPTHRIQAGFEGTAQALQQSMRDGAWLILGALLTMYIVLGMLYESTIHPVTILSTLPSAGIGALLALLLVDEEFTLIALIGIFLLIGLVKKNAIMMVDFALLAERRHGLDSRAAIREACLVRFRPIMMTTLSAMFGALPLILASGAGVEMRRPLGLTIVGGLFVSQILTLYTTPVVYLYLDRLRRRRRRRQTGPLSVAQDASQ
ncbi:MAG: efflux RND transporter permease subunit [Castellaniella sp.]